MAEEYLADPEDVDLDVKVLKWWQAKESKIVAQHVQHGQEIPIPYCPCVLGRSGARLQCCWQDARRPEQVGQGHDAGAQPLCSFQHRLSCTLQLTDQHLSVTVCPVLTLVILYTYTRIYIRINY